MQKALFSSLLVAAVTSVSQGAVFTFNWNDSFHIYGQRPDPHVNGFDYWFSSERIDPALAGSVLRVDKVRAIAPGDNVGDVINFDLLVVLSGSDMALPDGQQSIATHVDPVAGYSFAYPVHFHSNIGGGFTQNDYTFELTRDWIANTASAVPSLSSYVESRSNITLTDGLHAQLFFWTGDNRNCHIDFSGATLEVTATVLQAPPPAVPEPTSLVTWAGLAVAGLGWRLMRRKRTAF